MSSLFVVFRCVYLSCVEFVKVSASKHRQRSSRRDPCRSLSDSALHEPTRCGRLTRQDVALHNQRHDCWIIIKDKVYDVTSFLPLHPGGDVLLTQAGRDATESFTSFHAASTWSMLKKYHVADLTPDVPQSDDETAALLADFHVLRTTLIQRGMFRADPVFYAWKTALNFAIFASVGALLFSSDGWSAILMAAFLLALFWQQMGWLTHDFCHHQVFQNRRWNNLLSYLFGNVFQGFSVEWWKFKHNTHHAATNEIAAGDHAAIDPDIDTLPLLAWSSDMLESLSSPAERALIRYQHYYFIPILSLARFSWAQQSFSHAYQKWRKGGGATEFLLICLHYAMHVSIALLALPWIKAVLFLILSQALSGFMLGLAFVQSHNGMEIYGDVKDFVTSQLISTRDITHSAFVDFFMGGLNYQIEHHLFPTMPRHNLRKAQVAVKALCAKHGLPYEECTMTVGTRRVVQRLIDVAKLA